MFGILDRLLMETEGIIRFCSILVLLVVITLCVEHNCTVGHDCFSSIGGDVSYCLRL